MVAEEGAVSRLSAAELCRFNLISRWADASALRASAPLNGTLAVTFNSAETSLSILP